MIIHLLVQQIGHPTLQGVNGIFILLTQGVVIAGRCLGLEYIRLSAQI